MVTLLTTSGKYLGTGPLRLAELTHRFEGVDDIEFLAVQDAVERLTEIEQRMYREQYLRLLGSRGKSA